MVATSLYRKRKQRIRHSKERVKMIIITSIYSKVHPTTEKGKNRQESKSPCQKEMGIVTVTSIDMVRAGIHMLLPFAMLYGEGHQSGI